MLKRINKNIQKKIYPYPISPSGFIPSHFFVQNSKNKNKVLIIGDYSKRDYNIMNYYKKNTYLIDIEEIPDVKNFFKQSITEKTSFKNNTFDVIILAEVIEHLFEDKKALDEINRILKKDGSLFLSVPYYNDKPEFHARIHSSKTIRRLLKECGFSVEKSLTRGFVSTLSNGLLKYLIYSPITVLSKKNYISFYYNTESFISKHIPRFQSFFKGYGEIMICKKTKKVDFNAIQKKAFFKTK